MQYDLLSFFLFHEYTFTSSFDVFKKYWPNNMAGLLLKYYSRAGIFKDFTGPGLLVKKYARAGPGFLKMLLGRVGPGLLA